MPVEPSLTPQGFAPRRVPELEPHDPSLWETTKAAFQLESDVYNMIELASRPQYPANPGFTGDKLAAKLKETGFWDSHRDRFLRVKSEEEMTSVMQRIRKEESARATLGQAGWAGISMAIAAGVLSPTSFIPLVGAGARSFQAVRQGMALGALAAAGQEVVLYASQETRTLGEAAIGVAAGTVLGGILGPVAGRVPREVMERAGRDIHTSPGEVHTLSPVASEAQTVSRKAAVSRFKPEETTIGYHGSVDVIDEFDPDKTFLKDGVFFANEPNLANRFALREMGDEDPFVFPEDLGFVSKLEPLLTKEDFEKLSKTFDEWKRLSDDAYKNRTLVGQTEVEEMYERVNELYDELVKIAAKTKVFAGDETGAVTRAPNISKVRLNLGKNFVYDMGDDFDWDKEAEAIAKARAEGYDSITIKLSGKKGTEEFYSVFSKERIESFWTSEPDFELRPEATLQGLSAQAVASIPSARLKAPIKGFRHIFNWLAKLGPITRLAQVYDSEVGRQMVRQTGAGGLTYADAAKGIPAAEGGSIESRIKVWRARYDRLIESIDEQWKDEAFGGNVPLSAKLDPTGKLVPSGQRSKQEFQNAVGRFMFDETQEATPQVKKVAEVARKQIYEPLFEEAKKTGAIPAEFEKIVGDPTYLNRVWREEVISAHFPEFVRRMATHIRGKLENEFNELADKLAERELRDAETIEDLTRSPGDVERLRKQFEEELAKLEEGRSERVESIETKLDFVRETLAEMREARWPYPRVQEEKARRRALVEEGGEELKAVQAKRAGLNRRLRSLSRNVNLMESRLAAKLERIDSAEQLQYQTLLKVARKGKNVFDKLDDLSDAELDKEFKGMQALVGREGAKLERLIKRIEKEHDAKLADPLELEALAGIREAKLDQLKDKLAGLEDLDREGMRIVVEDMLLKAAVEAEDLMARRTRRLGKLREAAEKLGPEAREARIKKIKEKAAERVQKFNERVREDLKADDFDLEARRFDANDYAQELATAVAHKLLGTADRLPTMELIMDKRGSELARGIDAPSLDFAGGVDGIQFVETDIERLATTYINTLAPDTEIARKFGSSNAEEWLGKGGRLEQEETARRLLVEKEAKEKAAESGKPLDKEALEKKQSEIGLEYQAVRKDLEGLIDRMRGTRGLPREPRGWMARAARVALNLNATRFLGGTAIASIPDVGRTVMKYGLERSMRDGWGAFIQNTKLMQLSKREARLARSSDVISHARSKQILDVMDNYRFGTKPEKALEWLASRTGKFGLFDRWTDFGKQLVSSVVTAKMFDDIRILHEGGSEAEVASATEFLAKLNFTPDMVAKAWKEVRETPEGGELVDGLWLPNTEAWADQDLAFSFHAALAQEVDDAIVTPGLEIPLIMDANMGARLLFQFKRFGLSSVQKSMMAGMQEGDARAFMGIMLSLAAGGFSYYIWAVATGGPAYEEMLEAGPGKWADEAIARSGLLGVFSDVQNVAQRIPLTQPFASFSGRGSAARAGEDLISAMMGPTWDLVEQAGGVVVDLNDPTASTVHKLRTLIPYQNMFYIRRLFTMAEEGAVSALGLPDRRQ